jgi:transposase InsO family protein
VPHRFVCYHRTGVTLSAANSAGRTEIAFASSGSGTNSVEIRLTNPAGGPLHASKVVLSPRTRQPVSSRWSALRKRLAAGVYRLLKALDLIASPAYIVVKAADEFRDKTTAPNQLWQTDFTYLKVIGWGWFYLSTVLDDFSCYIIAWKLCATMRAEDVTATLDLALQASGLDQAKVVHRPRLLSDNGSSYAPPTSPNGSMAKTWITSAARRITP